ncbi:MAG: c-type cytochrome [Burkholderiales bacterium]
MTHVTRPRCHRLAAIALCSVVAGAAHGADLRLPDGPGVNLVYSKCQTCHDLQYIVDGKGLLPTQWNSVLTSMHDYGLQIDEAQTKQVLQYLTTYLGPNPPPASPVTSTRTAAVDGHGVYAENCASCHGAEGHGQVGYFPPLAGNSDLAKDAALPVLVVLNGMTGPIEVQGRSYNNAMPTLGHLSDAEIAAVVNFIRGWNQAQEAPLTPDAVAKRRQQRMTPTQVHDYRSELK